MAPQRDPVSLTQTRELYGGTDRNYGRIQYAAAARVLPHLHVAQQYTDIEDGASGRAANKWYLQGLWRNTAEALVHARNTNDLEDYLAFTFTARTVNVVLTLEDGAQPFDVLIEMDGRWLEPAEGGRRHQFRWRRALLRARHEERSLSPREAARVEHPRTETAIELQPTGDLRLPRSVPTWAVNDVSAIPDWWRADLRRARRGPAARRLRQRRR